MEASAVVSGKSAVRSTARGSTTESNAVSQRYAIDGALEEGGLSVVELTDVSELNLQYARETRVRAERGEPPVTANCVVMGDDFLERLKMQAGAPRKGE